MKIELKINDKTVPQHFSDAQAAFNSSEAKEKRKKMAADVFGIVADAALFAFIVDCLRDD
jgi:hypothetical protein